MTSDSNSVLVLVRFYVDFRILLVIDTFRCQVSNFPIFFLQFLDSLLETSLAFTIDKMSHSSTPFDSLPDDVIGNILLFCPFPTVAVLSQCVCKALRQRFQKWHPIWKEIYHRHGFFPPEDHRRTDYFIMCQQKRRLLSNLIRTTQTRGRRQPFSLPNRYFHFFPIVPTLDVDDEDYPVMTDPPPVYYECDSFVLTGGGTSQELLLLDPFDGNLRVLQNFLRDKETSDDTEMMQWHSSNSEVDTVQSNPNKLKNRDDDMEDNEMTKHYRYELLHPPSQCLLEGNEPFDLNLAEYFPNHQSRETEEYEMSFVGTEAKLIWRKDDGNNYELEGHMVGIGRCVRSLDHDSVLCTELTTWTRSATETIYRNRQLCRIPGVFDALELDACHRRVFVLFAAEAGRSSTTISVYPLVDWQEQQVGQSPLDQFPKELFVLHSQHTITTCSLESTCETLLVATNDGMIEIWKVAERTAHCQVSHRILEKLRSAIDSELTRRTSMSDAQTSIQKDLPGINHNHRIGRDDDLPTRFTVLRRQPDLPQFHVPIESFLVPKHLSLEQSGFLTFHHAREEGSSLLVWKLVKHEWQVVTLIHLRLSTRRKPCIAYDGNRIIVFGEDHIGPIILIYQVLNGDDLGIVEDDGYLGEASGGVYHLSFPSVVRFANRIRHVALGGIETFDSIHMTCNERFLIVNTRMGNHLGTTPFSDGLLVIDLQDIQ